MVTSYQVRPPMSKDELLMPVTLTPAIVIEDVPALNVKFVVVAN